MKIQSILDEIWFTMDGLWCLWMNQGKIGLLGLEAHGASFLFFPLSFCWMVTPSSYCSYAFSFCYVSLHDKLLANKELHFNTSRENNEGKK
jgi:hypothetical protein